MEALKLDEYLAIAAEVLEVESATIVRIASLPLAESALHAPFAGMADGTNGIVWKPPSENERVLTIEGLAAGRITEPDFVSWIRLYTVV